MKSLEEQLIETWQINHRVNAAYLAAMKTMLQEEADEEAVKLALKEFAHLHTMRYYKIEKLDKKLLPGIDKISLKADMDIDYVEKQLQASTEAITQILREALSAGELKSHKRGALPFLGALISHEGYHRSKAVSKLKAAKIPLPDTLKYNVWDWNNI